jgi:hypothetical protein
MGERGLVGKGVGLLQFISFSGSRQNLLMSVGMMVLSVGLNNLHGPFLSSFSYYESST